MSWIEFSMWMVWRRLEPFMWMMKLSGMMVSLVWGGYREQVFKILLKCNQIIRLQQKWVDKGQGLS